MATAVAKRTTRPAPADGAPLEGDVLAPAAPQRKLVTATVTFHGRELTVKTPQPEQLAVARRVALQLEKIKDQPDVDGEKALKLFDRAITVVTTVLVDPDDIEWLEDRILAGMELTEAAPLMSLAIGALREQNPGNRAERRASATPSRGRARRTT